MANSGSEYQVFLNFCGMDTRRGFTNTLYYALLNAGIHVFLDKKAIPPGEVFGKELLQAIDDSKLYITIFSPNYASHHWCLRELAKMVEITYGPEEDGNKKVDNTSRHEDDGNKKVIFPIFYKVRPNDLKSNTGLYSEAISELEQRMENQKRKFSMEEVKKWRWALQKVDGTQGLKLEDYEGDGHLSESVVEEVLRKLQTRHREVTKDLVGMENRIADINNLLDMESGDVRLIGIWGIGGMGKTTLAENIFNLLCPHFGKNCSFLADVRERAQTKAKGLIELQKKLLSDISYPSRAHDIGDTNDGIKANEGTLRKKKVLIVLDDVDNSDQIRDLIGLKPLYPGTRIIVTTRDKNVLNIRGFKYEIMPYEMERLSDKDALQLFSRHAFDVDSPPSDYFTLSKDIVSTAGGLPLALQAIGASLFGLEDIDIWKEKIKELRKIPHDDVLGMLETTYKALNFGQQQIFLDIACFFISYDKTNPIYMWEDCEFGPKYGINVLISRCMIKVLGNNKFWMHDQFRDLGRTISNREHSRLWARDDIIRELRLIEINKSVEALDYKNHGRDYPGVYIPVTSEQIKRFPNLRLLRLQDITCQGDFTNCLSQLRWMDLSYYHPSLFTATNLHPENVVVMTISGNGLREDAVISLVKGAKKLKVLLLSNIQALHRTPAFSRDSILEKLTFNNCENLKEIDCSIWKLAGLTHLSIVWSKELEELPEQIGKLKNLQHLSVVHCNRLTKLPDSVLELELLMELDVSYTGITGLPDSIDRLQKLSYLNLLCTCIVKLPETMSKLSQLHTLDLEHCHDIQELPKLPRGLTTLRLSSRLLQTVPDLSNLPNLVELHLSNLSHFRGESKIIQFCDLRWIGGLSKLRKLELCLLNVHTTSTDWASLFLLEELAQLEELALTGLDLQELKQLPSNLRVLGLSNTGVKQLEFDGLPQLDTLTINECDLIERLSISSSKGKLRVAEVSSCNKLVEVQFLGVFESMESLNIWECGSLKRLVCLSSSEEEAGWNELQAHESSDDGRSVSLVLSSLKKLQKLSLSTCPELQEIQFVSALESLKEFCVSGCKSLKRICGLSNLKNLKELEIGDCDGLPVVEGIDELERLEDLNFFQCRSMEKITVGGASLERLVSLSSSSEKPGWNELQARELSDGWRRGSLVYSSLKMLQKLSLYWCPELKEIQFVSALESLKEFSVSVCESLKRICGLSNLKNLKGLEIDDCESLRFVEGTDELERLELLKVYCCGSMEKIIDASSSKIPDECQICIIVCGELPDTGLYVPYDADRYGSEITWKRYRERILNAAAQASESGPSEQQDDGDKDDNNEADGVEDEDDKGDNVHEVLQSSRGPPPVSSMGDNDENDYGTEERKGKGDSDSDGHRHGDKIRKRKRDDEEVEEEGVL